MKPPRALRLLIDALSRLPGVGERSAQRLAFSLLQEPNTLEQALGALAGAKTLTFCRECRGVCDSELCEVCSDPTRESVVCVVETPADMFFLEEQGFYRGRYHVLGGVLSPADGTGPEQLELDSLAKRTEGYEVILALPPSVEGDATCFYIAELLKGRAKRVSRIARGLPTGSELSLSDPATLKAAFGNRTEL